MTEGVSRKRCTVDMQVLVLFTLATRLMQRRLILLSIPRVSPSRYEAGLVPCKLCGRH